MDSAELQKSVWHKWSWQQNPDLKQLHSFFIQSSEKIETSVWTVVTQVTDIPGKSSVWSQLKYDKG